MKKALIVFIVIFVMLFAAGCSTVAGQAAEKLISSFDKTEAELIITEHEQKIIELSRLETISKDQFMQYREDIAQTLGNDSGFEIANSFFDMADIENSETEELTRTSTIIYPSLISGNAYLESADIVEHTYKDELLGKKTYLKVSLLSEDKQMQDFNRTYYFEKIGDGWHFSHIDGVLTYSY